MAVPRDEELQTLLAEFVCVRLVQMHGVDLARFQFDFAMTWAVFFGNVDGTTYGRYGTRSAMRDESTRDVTVVGFKRSAAAALSLHRRYIAAIDGDPIAAELRGKQTQHAPEWPRAEVIPELAKHERMAVKFGGVSENRNERNHGVGCIHCHNVPNTEILSLRAAGKPVPERLIWPYPMPWSVGLFMDPEQANTIQRVRPESPAAAAGLRAGDRIVRCDGQAIVSTADVQWVLHHTRDSGRAVPVTFEREGRSAEATLELPAGWRRRLGDWRFVNLQVCMQIAGFQGRPRGGGDGLTYGIDRVHNKRHAEGRLLRGDTIVAIDGRREAMNLGQMTQHLIGKRPGSELELLVRRRGRSEPLRVVFEVR